MPAQDRVHYGKSPELASVGNLQISVVMYFVEGSLSIGASDSAVGWTPATALCLICAPLGSAPCPYFHKAQDQGVGPKKAHQERPGKHVNSNPPGWGSIKLNRHTGHCGKVVW